MFGKRARPLSLALLDSSPKGRALGSTVNFSVLPKAPTLGELSPKVTERTSPFAEHDFYSLY